MKTTALSVLAIGLLLSAIPARAAEHASFKDLWDEAAQCQGSTTKEYPDFTMVVCDGGRTYYYFTKPNHPAFPGVIKRTMIQKDGAWSVREDGHSYASDAAQPAFKAWLTQFQELDRQMNEAIAREHGSSSPNSN